MACAVTCKSANGLPDDIWWNKIYTVGGESDDAAGGVYPNLERHYTPVSCQNCESPACVAVCPTGASYVDETTGIVSIDIEVCIGCQLCDTACPYKARMYNSEEPTWNHGFKSGYSDAPDHLPTKASKCTYCANRLAQGEAPACMHLCPGRARFFGDFDDPTSEVSQLIEARENYRLMEEQGTDPSVFYLK